jgi:hypothetical protein
MMDELGVEVTKLHEAANFVLRCKTWSVFDNGLDLLGRSRNFASRHSVA